MDPHAEEARRLLRTTLIVTVGMIAGALLEWVPADPSPWRWLPLGAAYLVGGRPILRDTLETLREGRLSIDFLMGVAALGAAGVGQPLEGVILIFLFSLSNTLEAFAMGRTREAIASLMDLHPEEVTRLTEGGEERIPSSGVRPGDLLLIRPGERIGADGKVIEGRSEVDQAAITGESVPVSKGVGSEVFSGTINAGGALTIEVTKGSSDTMLARMVRMVEEAREARAPAQEFIDRFAHPYTLAVVFGSLATALAGGLLFGLSWGDAIYRATTLLVVASPCALVISTPAGFLSAIAYGARRGILFKGGAFLDLAGGIEVVAFDKTGTLTEGRPRWLDTQLATADTPGGGADREGEERALLQRAAAVEAVSEHHLARAVVEAAREAQLPALPATDFEAIPGEGVSALVAGKPLWIGNALMAQRFGSTLPRALEEWASEQGARARSIVFLGEEGRVLGAMSFGDRLRAGAKEVIPSLRRQGVRRIVILSGDHPESTASITRGLGADEVLGGLLPHEKVEAIRRLAEGSTGVAMVGDGVNDAPAMAAASVGIAMGAAGTDVAIETADIVLMSDDLARVGEVFRIGRRARRVVRQNVWFSVGWMGLLVLVASTIGLPLTLAVIAHEGSTILVVLNGLRLLRG